MDQTEGVDMDAVQASQLNGALALLLAGRREDETCNSLLMYLAQHEGLFTDWQIWQLNEDKVHQTRGRPAHYRLDFSETRIDLRVHRALGALLAPHKPEVRWSAIRLYMFHRAWSTSASNWMGWSFIAIRAGISKYNQRIATRNEVARLEALKNAPTSNLEK